MTASMVPAVAQVFSFATFITINTTIRPIKYPTSYFYNTYMHLTDAGTKARTQQLIKDLQAYMDGEAKYENK